MPLPASLVVDGTSRFLTEAGVSFGMVEVEVMESEIFELVEGEAQLPGDFGGSDGESVVMCWDERHGVIVK